MLFPALGKLRSIGLILGEPGSQGEFLRRGVTCPSWLASFVGNAYRECLENGTWASQLNYSQCVPIFEDKVSAPPALTLIDSG